MSNVIEDSLKRGLQNVYRATSKKEKNIGLVHELAENVWFGPEVVERENRVTKLPRVSVLVTP